MKKITKVLTAAVGALFALTAFAGCFLFVDSPEVGSIQIANPEVKAESIFGANKISWSDVDNAEAYIVYRQTLTEKEVEVTTKKGTTTEKQEILSDLEKVSEVAATVSSEKYEVLDYAGSSDILIEGTKIRYTVEAYKTGAVDSRSIATKDDLIDYARGVGTADVTIEDGNMPAKGTQLTTPVTAEVTVATRASNGALMVSVSPDAIANEDTVITKLKFFACDMGNGEDNNNLCWNFTNGGWLNNAEIEIPGKYNIYTYNDWIRDDGYYDDSKSVLAKEAVEVKATTSNTYTTPALSTVSASKVVKLSWEANKTLVAANPAFTISKYIVNPNKRTIIERVGTIDTSAAEAVVSTSENTTYTLYDKDVEELPNGEYYKYLLTVKAGDWIGRSLSDNVSYSELYNSWTPASISCDYDYPSEDVKDTEGNVIGVKYTNKANYYINGQESLLKGESLKLTVSKYSNSTGFTAETDVALTTTVLCYDLYGDSDIMYSAILKDVKRLDSTKNEYYQYKLYKTDKYGISEVYTWTSNDWDETVNLYNEVVFTVGSVTVTDSSITIPVTITSVEQNTTITDTKIRVVYYYTSTDMTETVKILDVTGFEEDTEITGSSKEKDIEIKGLPADTYITYYIFSIDSNEVMTSSVDYGIYSTLVEE